MSSNANFKHKFLLVERRNCRKKSYFWKLRWLISCKMSDTYLCVYLCIYFLSQPFFSSRSRSPIIFFAQDIVSLIVYYKIVKKQLTFDLYIEMLCNCLAYFSQNSQIGNPCINWWSSVKSVHYFPRVLFSIYF